MASVLGTSSASLSSTPVRAKSVRPRCNFARTAEVRSLRFAFRRASLYSACYKINNHIMFDVDYWKLLEIYENSEHYLLNWYN